jgi:hypothetical protein
VFLTGIVGFTLASLACGSATSQTTLIWARAVQRLGGAVVDAVAFALIVIESRVRVPLVPLGLFRSRALLIANIAAVLWAAATFASGFMGTLYLQRVLGHNAVQVALAFLPANVVTAVVALGFSARIVSRFGIRIPFAVGLLLGALGLALFAGAPVNGNILTDVLPGMTLLGIGSGIFFNPLLLAAMSGVEPKDSGPASGLLGTSSMMGGADRLSPQQSVGKAGVTLPSVQISRQTASMLLPSGSSTKAA